MANELKLNGYTTGLTLYGVIENAAGQVWNTSTTAFETYAVGNIASYAVALTEVASSTGRYRGGFPTGIAAVGRYNVSIYQRVGGTPAVTDTYAGGSDIEWKGAAELSNAADINAQTSKLSFDGSSYVKSNAQAIPNATVGGYAAGQDPASYVLSTPANKLAADASGKVGANNLPALPTNFAALVISSSGLVKLDLTQAIPLTNTAQTVGHALNAARAAGFGGLTLSGTALTMFAPDGTTAVRSFTLDSGTSPLRRS